MQPRPFEKWIEKGHQRDANLCGVYARPTDKRSLVMGGEGYNQAPCVYFAKACGDSHFRLKTLPPTFNAISAVSTTLRGIFFGRQVNKDSLWSEV